MATNSAGSGQSCRAAALAAMEVIEEECGDGKKPVEIGDDKVVMMPPGFREMKKGTNPSDLSSDDVERIIDGSDWLSEWTASMCSDSGIPESSDAFDACRRNWARKALS